MRESNTTLRRFLSQSTTPPPHWIASAVGHHGKIIATTPPPPHWIASAFGNHGTILLLPPPPQLNRVGFRRPRKNSATTPPPPLNRVDLALHTKGAASLGKSWICDWILNILHRVDTFVLVVFAVGSLLQLAPGSPNVLLPISKVPNAYTMTVHNYEFTYIPPTRETFWLLLFLGKCHQNHFRLPLKHLPADHRLTSLNRHLPVRTGTRSYCAT